MAVALDAPDIWQVLIALHQGVVVGLLVQLSVHQRPLLLTCLCLQEKNRPCLSSCCAAIARFIASATAGRPHENAG